MSIDHKAKAVKHIENVGDFNNSESSDWPLVNATVAVAEATLYAAEQTAALVEQQRIANQVQAASVFGLHPARWPSEIREAVTGND